VTIRILFAPTADLAKGTTADITVEAEYGSHVWEGSLFTAAHHQKDGPYRGRHQGGDQPSPCNNHDIPLCPEGGVIGVSHFDLDTLGGVLRAMGLPGFFGGRLASFWDLAEFVDVNGPHRLSESEASEEDLAYLHAFWAWSSANRNLQRGLEAVTNVTTFFLDAEVALRAILQGDEALLAAGQEFREAGERLNADSFVDCDSGVVCRVHPGFTNHLYVTPKGCVAKAVVAFNQAQGSITISLAQPVEGVSCREIVQDLWGPDAGGHDGIAGSPRGVRMRFGDLNSALAQVQCHLRAKPW